MIGVLLRVACGLMIGSHMPFIFIARAEFGHTRPPSFRYRLTWHAIPAFIAAACLIALSLANAQRPTPNASQSQPSNHNHQTTGERSG